MQNFYAVGASKGVVRVINWLTEPVGERITIENTCFKLEKDQSYALTAMATFIITVFQF